MFLKILTDTLMIFLITYALIDILYRFFSFIYNRMYSKKHSAVLVISADCDDNLENLIRTTAKNSRSIGCEFAIILKNKTAETDKIISQLYSEYPYMNILSLSDETISQIFSDISSKDE